MKPGKVPPMAGRRKATAKGKGAKKGGPFLAAAFFCEKTLLEASPDEAVSAIRLIDHITVTLPADTPVDFPSEENRLDVPVAGLISFKTGDAAPGKHNLRLITHSPTGKVNEPWDQTIEFSAEPYGGSNLRLKNVFQVVKGGLFWVDVILDGQWFTRIPLWISIQRQGQTQADRETPISS
jgi:hypothetical protein